MQNKLSIQQKQLIDSIRQNNPDLRTYSDEEILSVLNNSASEIKMSEDEKISILSAIAGGNELSGLNLEKTASQTLTLPKEQESQLISVLKQRINSVTQKTKEAESKNGFLGKAWNWTKNNLLDWCTDSTNDIKKAQEEELKLLDSGNIKDAFTQITGLEFNQDNLNKFLNNEIHTKSEQALEGYKEGQEMAADFAGDMISGIAAVGIYMVAVGAAPFSGGASLGLIALGTAVAGTGAGLIKSGLKYADAKSAGQEYNTFGKDMITGSFSGILAPFTGGVGGAVGRNVATKLGVEVVKQVGKETVKQTGKQTLKTILTNPTGYEYLGGTLAKRALSLGSEMAVDGALGGAIDGTFREGVEEINKDGSLDIGKLGSAFLQGGIGGFVAAPVIGGGLKGVGKAFGKTKIALNNGKTLEVTEGFGLTYRQADSNLEKGTLLFNNKPVASTKQELLNQLKEKGLDPKKEYQLERFIKNLKTEEDIQRASILFSQRSNIYYVERAFNETKTLDDVAILSMLWDKKLSYGEKRAIECIRENPLLFNVYQEALPVLGDNYHYILDRTIASKIKTAEDCELFLHIIKSNDSYMTTEALYQKGYIPKNMDEANSIVSVLNYLSGYDYRSKIDSIESFLTLPQETRSALEKHIRMSKKNPNNSYYPLTLRKEVFDSILKDLQDEDIRPSLTQFINKIDDFEKLERLYQIFLSPNISTEVRDKEVIERLNRLIDTGVDLIDSSSYYETRYYISKTRRSTGEVVFDTEQKYFDELISVLEDEAIKSKLGRAFDVNEANRYTRYIKTDYQRDFVLSHLNKDMKTDKIEKLLERSGFIKNKEQVALAEFLLDKPDDFKLLKTDYYSKRVYDLFDCFKTKEDIDFFIKLYDTLPMEDTPRARVISQMFFEDSNISQAIRLMDELPNIEKSVDKEIFSKFIIKYNFENGQKLLSMLETLIKLRPELAEKLNNQNLVEYDFIEKIKTPEVMQTVSRNIEILSKADKEFFDLIKVDKMFTSQVELKDVLLAPNLDMEKFHLLKSFIRDGWNDPDELFEIVKSSHSIERIRELMPKLDNLSDLNYLLKYIIPGNEKLYNLLVTDPRFDMLSIRRSIQLPYFTNEADKLSIINARVEFYNKFKANNSANDSFVDILSDVDSGNLKLAEVLFQKSGFPKDKIVPVLRATNKGNQDLAQKLCETQEFSSTVIENILYNTNAHNSKLAMMLCFDPALKRQPNEIMQILRTTKPFVGVDVKGLSLSAKINKLEAVLSLPKDMVELCNKYTDTNIEALISELTTALGKKRDAINISARQQQLFVQKILANNNRNADNVLKNFDFQQFGKEGLPLKYTRAQFNENIETLIKDLSPEEQSLVLEHFGLIRGVAGFDGLPTNKVFSDETASARVHEIAKKVQSEIETFTSKNQINTGDAVVDDVLNGLVKGLPEFTSVVGKLQHDTHAYSVDIHTLKVLQSAMNHPLYDSLTDADKTILKIVALCHDLGKRGGVIDKGHASLSAEYVIAILDKFSFPRRMKDRIIDIVENHHWFEAYNLGEATAEDVAVRCTRPQDFAIYEIMAKSDFENVNDNFHISNSKGVSNQAEFNQFMSDKMTAIDEVLNRVYSRANLVFDTQFMLNGEKFPRKTVLVDGEPTELKVLNFNDLADDAPLQSYGFSRGVTKDSARFTVHMKEKADYNSFKEVIILTQNSMNQSAWSTSLIKASNNRTYTNYKYGFVFDVDQANISEAYYMNTHSGTEKGLRAFQNILFNSNNEARTYVRDNLIKELSNNGIELNDSEYSQLARYLVGKKYTTQITKDVSIGDKVIKASTLVECLEKSRDKLFEGGDIHSEIVPINPRVKGLIAKVEKLEDCPEEFLRFAKDHDLPIIIMREEIEL